MITAPRWTDLEVIKWLAGTLVPLVTAITTGIWYLFKHWYARKHAALERDAATLHRMLDQATKDLEWSTTERLRVQQKLDAVEEDLRSGRHPRIEALKGKLEEERRNLTGLENSRTLTEAELDGVRLDLAERCVELEQAANEVARQQGRERAHQNRIRRALKLEGLIWEARVPHNAPAFRPLAQRRTPIISVMNLKGGVGKTTLAANLGVQFAHLGRRVLLLDLDLQGSLTNLFLNDLKHRELYDHGQLIQNYLDGQVERPLTNLLDFIQETGEQTPDLVPTADTLAYTEMNLTLKWLLRLAKRDVRFLLRRALHQKRITRQYDLILLDCPPLLNVTCVNALAASDYVLIPVMPSAQATNRVPPLLKHLKQLRAQVNHNLGVLGVVANRTARSELTHEEESRWATLRDVCKDNWGDDVYLFERNVRQNTEIRTNEDARQPLQRSDVMYPVFRELAQELLSRLPAAARDRLAPKEKLSV